jgi:hypothetical protein
MIGAEQLGEPLVLLGVRGQHLGPQLLEQPLVVPEVLDPLAPLVQALDGGLVGGGAQRVAAALVGGDDAVDERRAVGAVPGQRLHPLDERLEPVGGLGGRVAGLVARVGQHEGLARAGEVGFGQAPGVALGEVLIRRAHDVGVARARQQPGRVAQLRVELAHRGAGQPGAGQAQQRAGLLHRLARVVDRLAAVVVGVAQAVRGALELLGDHPAQLMGQRFVQGDAIAHVRCSAYAVAAAAGSDGERLDPRW